MNIQNYTAGFSAYPIVGGLPYVTGWLVSVYIYPTAVASLGLATVTFRWNDGTTARAETVGCALSTLGARSGLCFPALLAANQDLTVEAAMVGVGAQFTIAFALTNA